MTWTQRAVTAAAATVGLVFAAFLLAQGLLPGGVSEQLAGTVSNLTQMVVPLLGAVVCLDSSRRQVERRQRRTWVLLGIGVGAWASGQAVFAWYELVLHAEVPVPSAADVGFLGFPVLATIAAIYLPSRAPSTAAGFRSVLDGLVIATSLLVVAWVTSLRSLWGDGTADLASLVVTTAYPVGDVLILTMVLLRVAGADRVRGRVLFPLALGLGSFAVADIGYVFATTAGTYASGAAFDLGWVSGFLLIAVAAVMAHPGTGRTTGPAPAGSAHLPAAPAVPSWGVVLLPYVSLVVAGVVVLERIADADPFTMTEMVLSSVLVLMVLTRQLVALADNRWLMAELHSQHDVARYQALHDNLTGLGNRALFLDRVTHALALNRRDGGLTTVLFCDLDNFKLVNDVQGHAAGDEVLVEASRRLRGELREQDTLARLGGDEFAILLERSPDPGAVASRIVSALSVPMTAGGQRVELSISIGVASVSSEHGVTTDQLLRRADRAMYLVKADGKAGWRHVEGPDDVVPGSHPSVFDALPARSVPEPVGLTGLG